MATTAPITYIEVTRIPGLAPALRSIKALNFVKTFLHVVPQSEAHGWDGRNRTSFYPRLGSDVSVEIMRAAPFWGQPTGSFQRTYEHKLPMEPLECLSRLSEDVAAFEEEIDDFFFKTLHGMLQVDQVIHGGSLLTCLQTAKQTLEAKMHPAFGCYMQLAFGGPDGFNIDNGMQRIFVPRGRWRHDPGYMIVTSKEENCGVMVTSPLNVEIKVDIPILKLTLTKVLGFLIDPTAFVECHSKEEK